MRSRLQAMVRAALLRLRLHRVAGKPVGDPYSPEYLYLVQQSKRLSLATSVARLRPRNLLILPLVVPVILIKTVDLWIANQIIRSLINERDLMRQSIGARPRD